MVAEEMPAAAEGVTCMTSRDALAALWDDATRPKLVADTLVSLGAEKLLAKVGLDEKVITGVASMTTISGLREKKEELTEIAAPYVAKAYTKDGRKELMDDLAATPLAQSVKAKAAAKLEAGKEYAAPYLATVKETSAPYVAKLEALRRSERVEAMVAAFQEAREHPSEKVSELRAAAVDLIKYENLQAYREHVMSAEFQADTARLVQVDLPAIAASAAKKGAETVKAKALALSGEIDEYKSKVKAAVATGYEAGRGKVTEAYEKVPTKAELKEKLEAKVAELKEKVPTKAELEALAVEYYGKVPTKAELEALAVEYYGKAKERVPTPAELEAMRTALKEKLAALVTELQAELGAELKLGVEAYKTEGFSYADTVERLKRVVGVFDKLIVAPIRATVAKEEPAELKGEGDEASSDSSDSLTSPAAELSIKALDGETVAASLVIKGFEPKASPDSRPLPPTMTGSVTDTDDEVMEDALE